MTATVTDIPVVTRKDGKLKADIKKRWVAALRSGKYEQGYDQLVSLVYDDPWSDVVVGRKYCCLGVLACELGLLDRVDGEDFYLPIEMGLPADNKAGNLAGNFTATADLPVQNKLARFNDDGKSFKWIASYIERYL